VQQGRQGHCVKNDQHQVAAGAIEQNTPDRGAQGDAHPAATPCANGVATDTGRQDLIKEQADKHDLQ